MTGFEKKLVELMKDDIVVDALTHGVWAVFSEEDYEKVMAIYVKAFVDQHFESFRDHFQRTLQSVCSKSGRDFQTLVAKHPELGFREALAKSVEEFS